MSDLSTTLTPGVEVQTESMWIDPVTNAQYHIYRKVIDVGAMPNAGAKNVAHNIANIKLDAFHRVRAGWSAGGGAFSVLSSGLFTVAIGAANVVVTDTTNLSAQSGFVVIEYCKTTG